MNENFEDNNDKTKSKDDNIHIQLKSLFGQWTYLKNLLENNIFDIISKFNF
jgi:hypothetical protein